MQRLIRGRGDKPLSVRAELSVLKGLLMPQRFTQRLAIASIPNPRRTIIGGGNYPLAIRTELRRFYE